MSFPDSICGDILDALETPADGSIAAADRTVMIASVGGFRISIGTIVRLILDGGIPTTVGKVINNDPGYKMTRVLRMNGGIDAGIVDGMLIINGALAMTVTSSNSCVTSGLD